MVLNGDINNMYSRRKFGVLLTVLKDALLAAVAL